MKSVKSVVKIRWFLKALLLAFCLWLAFILTGQALRRVTIRQIAELTGAKVKTKSVDFNLNGSVGINELAISPHTNLSRAQSREYGDDEAILKAETVYARFGLSSLLLLRPRLKEITVNGFVFDARYNLDTGRWNVAALKIKLPERGSGKMPIIHLENGTLQYSKVSNGQVKVIAAAPVGARLTPAKKTQDGYSFEITTAERAGLGKSSLVGSWRPGLVVIAGGISSVDLPAFERAWRINILAAELKYDPNNDYSLKLSVKDLLGTYTITPDTLALASSSSLQKPGLFTALQRFFNRFRPAGTIDIGLQASGNLNQPAESALRGKVHCKDVSIIDRKFPYPVRHIAGLVDFTERSFELKSLTGQHGSVNLVFNGWSRDFGPSWKYKINITSNNMILDNDLYSALSPRRKQFWSALSPTGLAAIDYRFSRQSQTDKKKVLAVELLDAEAACPNFPYPLKNLTGRLTITKNTIKLTNITGRIKGKSLTNVKADFDYDPRRQRWLTENLIADCYDGRLTGKFELKQSTDRPWQYLLQTGFDNIDLKQFLSDTIHEPRVNGYTSGKMNGSLNVTGWIGRAGGNNHSRIGRLRLQITDMRIGKLSPLAKLLYVLKLTEPRDFAFSQMLVDSYIKDSTLLFEKLDLSGQAVAFNGSGSMDLKTQNLDLTLTARGQRLATAEPSVLQSLTEGLGQAVVQMQVTGNCYDPQVTTITTLPVIKETLEILGTPR